MALFRHQFMPLFSYDKQVDPNRMDTNLVTQILWGRTTHVGCGWTQFPISQRTAHFQVLVVTFIANTSSQWQHLLQTVVPSGNIYCKHQFLVVTFIANTNNQWPHSLSTLVTSGHIYCKHQKLVVTFCANTNFLNIHRAYLLTESMKTFSFATTALGEMSRESLYTKQIAVRRTCPRMSSLIQVMRK